MVRSLRPWSMSGAQLIDAVRREVDDLVGRIQDTDAWTDEASSFAPRADVAETDKQFEIMIDMPAMTPENFNIEMHEGRLTVSGERTSEEKTEGKAFHRVERHYGKFRRTFNLGHEVEADSVTRRVQRRSLNAGCAQDPEGSAEEDRGQDLALLQFGGIGFV